MMIAAKFGACGLVALLALGACAKSSDSSSAGASAQPLSVGAQLYQTNCSSCHQAVGKGVPNTFPPLAGNDVVVGDATHVIHIVRYGLTGPQTVSGATYNGIMPAWSSTLSNDDIAQVVSYIRSSWGNAASAVTAADVAAVKQ